MLTLREHWGRCAAGRIAFVGDGNNVATSLAHAARMLGVTVHIASPRGYELPARVVQQAARASRATAPDPAVHRSATKPCAGADADLHRRVDVDGPGARSRTARRQIFAPYQVNDALMAAAEPDALFMHCLPAHRGEEVTSDVIESPASVVFDQAENRLHTQKALLLMLLS